MSGCVWWCLVHIQWCLGVSGACLVQDIPGQTREDQFRGHYSRTCVLVFSLEFWMIGKTTSEMQLAPPVFEASSFL